MALYFAILPTGHGMADTDNYASPIYLLSHSLQKCSRQN